MRSKVKQRVTKFLLTVQGNNSMWYLSNQTTLLVHSESLGGFPGRLLGYHRSVDITTSVYKWGSRLLGEEADGGISSGGEDPGLCGVKGHIQNAEVMSDHMTSKNLHRDNQRVLQQVTEGGQEVSL